MRTPLNKEELRSYLGLFPFYSQLAEYNVVLAPPRKLMKKNENFVWTQECEEAFMKSKKIFADKKNAFFDSTKKIYVYTDTSKYHVGGALIQEGKVVCYKSRSLDEAETRSSTIERECLAEKL
jgi:hypothetical protein